MLRDDPAMAIAQRSKFVDIITRETERLSRLINQVLDLSKIESGKSEWHESQFDMEEVVCDTVAGMGQLFEEKNIKVEVRIAGDVTPVVGDVDRIIQVLLNLLSNAVKFCDAAKGRIEIALAK